MRDNNELIVTIKVKTYEFQSICEIINNIEETDVKNKDTVELDLEEKHFVSSILKRLAASGRRKADKLEAIGTEVRNSMDFACMQMEKRK